MLNMKKIASILICIAMLFGCSPAKDSGMDIHTFSIGKADCSLLSFDGINVLIDTGEDDDGDDIVRELKNLRVEKLDLVILTKGPDGSEVITSNQVIPQGTDDVEIVDTVGAGDSFTAAFVVSYLRGDTLTQAQRLASKTASYVCSRKGAMPQ